METKEGLKILEGVGCYKALFIDSSRIEECVNYLYANNLRHITINSFQGYKSKNLDFLYELTDFLEGITIPETFIDISPVNKLHNLKKLGFVDNGKDTIDLSNFPLLERVACDYSPRLVSLETCSQLKDLTLSNYKSQGGDLLSLPKLSPLENLSFMKPQIKTLNGINRFENLSQFQIYGASKLETISPLQSLSQSIEFIEIDRCTKINDYAQAFRGLTKLKKLIISDSSPIPTLSFVSTLPSLQFLSFVGTNILDGNIAYCEGLSYVGFDDKRHYSHRMCQFKKT